MFNQMQNDSIQMHENRETRKWTRLDM